MYECKLFLYIDVYENSEYNGVNEARDTTDERDDFMKKFTLPEALEIAKRLGIDFDKVKFTPEEYLEGLNIELEHGTEDWFTNVTNDDPLTTGKIALAHLNEVPTYYNSDIGLEAWEHALKEFKGDPKGKKIQII